MDTGEPRRAVCLGVWVWLMLLFYDRIMLVQFDLLNKN
jgi:hypothetical protein